MRAGAAMSVLGVAAVFLLSLSRTGIANAALALGVGLLLLLLARAVTEPAEAAAPRPGIQALAGLPALMVAMAAQIATGTWRMALIVAGVRAPAGGFVEIPLGGRSRRGAVFTGLAMTLSPGAVLLDIDLDRGVMVFHQVTREESAFRREVEQFYDQRQRRVVP